MLAYISLTAAAPEIMIPIRRIGQARGREAILECIINAFPLAVNYWEKDGRRISSSTKYRTEAYDVGDHTIVLSLRIHETDLTDYGEYKCVASNLLGQDQQVLYLYGKLLII
jgi:Immunoglobulin I-set domain